MGWAYIWEGDVHGAFVPVRNKRGGGAACPNLDGCSSYISGFEI